MTSRILAEDIQMEISTRAVSPEEYRRRIQPLLRILSLWPGDGNYQNQGSETFGACAWCGAITA